MNAGILRWRFNFDSALARPLLDVDKEQGAADKLPFLNIVLMTTICAATVCSLAGGDQEHSHY